MTTTSGPSLGEGSGSSADLLAARLLEAGLATLDLLAVHLGDQLGWYRALARSGPMTPEQLAAASGTNERYTREWLEQQAVTRLLVVLPDDGDTDGIDDGDSDSAAARRYALPAAAREVLTERTSTLFTTPLARLLAAAAGQLPALVQAYKQGTGVPWGAYGSDMRTAQAEMNRPWLEGRLPEVLRSDAQLASLLGAPGARAADVGCGAAWSSVALARTFPGLLVDALDADRPTVDHARSVVRAAGLADRVRVDHAEAAGLPPAAYDAVFLFECLHDLPHPVEALAAALRALRPGGVVVVMDEAVAERFTAPGDDVERLMYGFSLLVCLPDGMSSPGSAATGTVMRAPVLRRYAWAAGFSAVEVMPVEDFGCWRFYRLLP